MSEGTEMVKSDSQSIETMKTGRTVVPPVDIYENNDEILLYADLPGVESDELSIHFEKRTLTLEGHRKLEEYERSGGQKQIESLTYHRAFSIPEGIDVGKIKAKLNNGVLQLHLPKAPAMKPRQIKVTAG